VVHLILNLGCGDDARGDVRIDRNPLRSGANIIADIHHLPLRDKVVKASLGVSVFEHLTNPSRGLIETARVSREFIRLVIPNVYYFKRILRALVNPGYKVKSGVLHLQAWDLLAFKRFVDQVEAVEIVSVEWVDFVFKFYGILIKWPSLFFGWNMRVTLEVTP